MIQSIYAIILFATCMSYFLFGIYSVTRNINKKLNLVFFLVCLSFMIWSYGFAMSNALDNYEKALFWRRFSAIGWGSAFSFILHFILILTGKNKVLSHKWSLIVLYLPALLTIVVFSLYSPLANLQYQLVLTEAGWGNLPLNNIFDKLYNLYYSGFSLVILILLLHWYKISVAKILKKQALILLISFFVSIIIGSLSEMLLNSVLENKIPSIAPIVIVIPIAAIYYSVIKLGLMNKPENNEGTFKFSILDSDSRLIYINYISILYFFAATTNLLLFSFCDLELSEVFLWSTLLFGIGGVIFILPYLSLSGKIENLFLSLIIAGSIPAILIGISAVNVVNAVWPIPLLFMLVTIVFNNKTMLTLVYLASIISGLYLWFTADVTMVQLGDFDFIVRTCIYLVCILIVAYINRLYVKKIHENNKQVVYQKIVSEISTDFITVTKENFHMKIENMMEKYADFIKADRAYMGLWVSEYDGMNILHTWQRDHNKTGIAAQSFVDLSSVLTIKNQLFNNQIVSLPNSNLTSENSQMVKSFMENFNMASLLYLPITRNDEVIGFIGFDHCSEPLQWREEDGALLRVIANHVGDGKAKIDSESELNYLAYYDVLTELPNRSLFNDRLIEAIELANQKNDQIGLILIDLDGFKLINDTFGHENGDELLRELAQQLLASMTVNAFVSRVGGDEFLLMVPNMREISDLEAVVQRLMTIFESPFSIGKQEIFVTSSVGIAIFPKDGTKNSTLIKNADLAMYAAKKRGKNQFVFYADAMNEESIKKMIMTNSLKKAIERKEFKLLYQPITGVENNLITGIEVCLRWEHPDLGMVLPEVFLPLAEQNNSIHEIGQWVIMTASKQNKLWQKMGLLSVPISINLSIAQFLNYNFIKSVGNCIEVTGLEPQFLDFKLKESVAMNESDNLLERLNSLKKIGVSITLDDFGKEYSSLSKLKDLPINRLKIEKAFIQEISRDEINDSILSVIVYLAKSLNLKVMAGGVSTQVQLDFLKKLECDEVQGDLFYQPVNKEVIEKILGIR